MLSSQGTKESSLHRQGAEREASDASPSSELLELERLTYSVVPGVAERVTRLAQKDGRFPIPLLWSKETTRKRKRALRNL